MLGKNSVLLRRGNRSVSFPLFVGNLLTASAGNSEPEYILSDCRCQRSSSPLVLSFGGNCTHQTPAKIINNNCRKIFTVGQTALPVKITTWGQSGRKIQTKPQTVSSKTPLSLIGGFADVHLSRFPKHQKKKGLKKSGFSSSGILFSSSSEEEEEEDRKKKLACLGCYLSNEEASVDSSPRSKKKENGNILQNLTKAAIKSGNR